MPSRYPFPIQEKYTSIAIAYKNNKLIADEVLPVTPVGSREFGWMLHTKEEGYTVPDTRVGRRGSVNQITFSSTNQTDSCEDYALEDPIPQDDIEQARANNSVGMPTVDPVAKATEYLTNLLELDKEIRVANLVFNAATYPTANKVTLSGTSQYSDYTNSNPLSDMLTRLDVPLMRPNLMVIGRDAWRVLRQHPRIVEAVKGTGAGVNAQGTIAAQQLAELLEIDQIMIGEGWVNTAARGLTPTYARVWGKHIAFMYRDKMAGPQMGVTFGFNAMWGNKIAGSIPDEDIGMRGGVRLRVGYSCKEIVSAADLGYFIQNAVA